jgi:hypothetical protein
MSPFQALTQTLLALLLGASSPHLLAHGEHPDHLAAPPAVSTTSWTRHAQLQVTMSRGAAPGMRVEAIGGEFDHVVLQTPEAPAAVALDTERGGWTVSKAQMGSGGHLWFMATRENAHEVVRATTYYFFPARPQVPTEMLRTPRGGLEIVPLRLQEHGGTREGSRWRFLLRHDNQPLPGQRLTLETEGGSRQLFIADSDGVAEISFPRDFMAERLTAKEGMNARQAFVLSVEHDAGGKHHLTTYNHVYNPDRMRERNLALGAGVFALGMALAVPLLRRKEKKHA